MNEISASVILVTVFFLSILVMEVLIARCKLQSPGLARHRQLGNNLAVGALLAEVVALAVGGAEEAADDIEIVPIMGGATPRKDGACEQRRWSARGFGCRRVAVMSAFVGAAGIAVFVLAVRELAGTDSLRAASLPSGILATNTTARL